MRNLNWISLCFLLWCVPERWFVNNDLPWAGIVRRMFNYSTVNNSTKAVLQRADRRNRKYFDHIRPVDLLHEIEGPVRDRYYNPLYGYEPYWPERPWSHKATTEKQCKVTCYSMYRNYGEICGVRAIQPSKERYNFTMKTFPNYCYMLEEDCMAESERRINWTIAYRGPCLNDTKVYMNDSRNYISRSDYYLQQYYQSSHTTIKYDKDFDIMSFTYPTNKQQGKGFGPGKGRR